MKLHAVHPFVAYSLKGLGIALRTLFSNTYSLCSFVLAGDDTKQRVKPYVSICDVFPHGGTARRNIGWYQGRPAGPPACSCRQFSAVCISTKPVPCFVEQFNAVGPRELERFSKRCQGGTEPPGLKSGNVIMCCVFRATVWNNVQSSTSFTTKLT